MRKGQLPTRLKGERMKSNEMIESSPSPLEAGRTSGRQEEDTENSPLPRRTAVKFRDFWSRRGWSPGNGRGGEGGRRAYFLVREKSFFMERGSLLFTSGIRFEYSE